jgi:antirestriction protein ArdC
MCPARIIIDSDNLYVRNNQLNNVYSGIYYYHLKTQHKFQQLDKTLWLTYRQDVTQPSSGQSGT